MQGLMRSALAFSGGRDSLALLLHMRALWDCVDVVFVDTGDAYQSTRDTVMLVASLVPRFTRLRTNSRMWRDIHGLPDNGNWPTCCAANIWTPLQQHLRDSGYRQILRGDRADEGHLQIVQPGDVVEGVLYSFPLWHWTEAKVNAYLQAEGWLAEPYRQGAHSMPDCRGCTASDACGGATKHLWDAHDTAPLHPVAHPAV